MKRTSLILSFLLLFAGGVWAEQKVCELDTKNYPKIDSSIEKCLSGDIITWRSSNVWHTTFIVSRYCHQEKQITIGRETSAGVCTYTGKKLEIRQEEESWLCGPTWKEFCPNESDKCMEQLRYNVFGKEQYCYKG
jgi:hypothetical protein